jgi:hypothetical protein
MREDSEERRAANRILDLVRHYDVRVPEHVITAALMATGDLEFRGRPPAVWTVVAEWERAFRLRTLRPLPPVIRQYNEAERNADEETEDPG